MHVAIGLRVDGLTIGSLQQRDHSLRVLGAAAGCERGDLIGLEPHLRHPRPAHRGQHHKWQQQQAGQQQPEHGVRSPDPAPDSIKTKAGKSALHQSIQGTQAARARDPHGKKDHSEPTVATVQAEGEKARGFSVISQRRLMTSPQTG